jgi:hypothetical protein
VFRLNWWEKEVDHAGRKEEDSHPDRRNPSPLVRRAPRSRHLHVAWLVRGRCTRLNVVWARYIMSFQIVLKRVDVPSKVSEGQRGECE